MKALCIFSGGLDSILAVELIRTHGIDVTGFFFDTPFFKSGIARKSALSIGLPLKIINITKRHLEIVKNPKHGYGGNMNPCIDCHILMCRIAGEMLDKEGTAFVITGEVLGQRPMSQNIKALSMVAHESGLGALLLRPLSAGHLPPTIPEEKGWVKRELLMDFHGRSRKPQIALAKRLNINDYPNPAGGCLLTEKGFSRRLKDLISFSSPLLVSEIELLKLGRHFRINAGTKLVAGRNEKENELIHSLSGDQDIILTTISVPGPVVLVSGDLSDLSFEISAAITAAYSDAEDGREIPVRITGILGEKTLITVVRDKNEFRQYMI
ncbi:MAG: tRNA 4-thiouridine(8) synthase ThiI [Desulfobacteraceae bacterium 4484_190.1]|nr:MAG: tRNA 4-thiouridine(8) synthase ThiI [Desulfobacteraceae bacterium 4484_190.1]